MWNLNISADIMVKYSYVHPQKVKFDSHYACIFILKLCTHTQKYLDSLLVALIGLLLVDRYYEVETYTVMIIIQVLLLFSIFYLPRRVCSNLMKWNFFLLGFEGNAYNFSELLCLIWENGILLDAIVDFDWFKCKSC